MRKSYGMVWVIQFVLIFILIFAAYLALSIKYSKTFKMKNEVINIIEKNQKINSHTLGLIEEYLDHSGYDVQGECPSSDGWMGVNGSHIEYANFGKDYDYCLNSDSFDYSSGYRYYELKLFYKFGLPVIDDIATFEVDGETIDIPIN